MPLLTCKQFLDELNDFLDDTMDPAMKAELQRHVNECPNCWVVCDTTEKTLKVFKGMQLKPVPQDIERRLLEALERKIKAKAEGRKSEIAEA
jgi:hypothetical protein